MITRESFEKSKYGIDDLIEIMKILRKPDGCPWDKEQNHSSIRFNMLEEAYEVADAIDFGDDKALCEELGDVLLQVVFHSQIASDENSFCFDDVADGICKKLILRHPHIFGSVKADTSEKVLENWDRIKKDEKNQTTYYDTLASVPKAFPALMRASKVQKRASKAGLDWKDVEGAVSKLYEETAELKKALNGNNPDEINEEFGDLLFSAVNVSRYIGVNAEDSLSKATDKFLKRFYEVESIALSRGRNMREMSADELDEIWKEVKSGTR